MASKKAQRGVRKMSKQQDQAATTATATTGDAWGQPISEERQAELEQYLLQWEAEGDTGHGMRRSPFDVTPSDRMWSSSTKDLASRPDDSAIILTGADVFYLAARTLAARTLAARTLAGPEGDVAAAAQRLLAAQKEAALIPASRRSLSDEMQHKLVYLQGADLREAHLEGAILYGAHLEDAILYNTHLQGAFLWGARLDGTRLRDADLRGTVLRRAWFDDQTNLTDAMLDDTTCLADIRWRGVGGVNLTTINWDPVPILGDEQGVSVRSDVSDHERVVRVYRQLASQLRAQGMSEVADRFLHRAQVRQRTLQLRRGRIPQWLGSWVIAALAGYGFKPGRTILWYLATIAAFAVAYFLLGPSQGHVFHWYGALIFSVTSFHGRGFFPENLSFESWVTGLAALEAVLGLLIEISFIATFTQRFFNAR
jgi:hypothetical protein